VANLQGRVIWITGFSGSGKTTLAKKLSSVIDVKGRSVVRLDGDELREVFGATTDHGRKSRLALSMQYGQLCKLLSLQGYTVIIATISMFREVYEWNRSNLPNYLEVYLKVPVAELRRRDPKGIYRRFDNGELKEVAGMDVAVDDPDKADLIFDYSSKLSVETISKIVVDKLNEKVEVT
jgi:adenylylsulfate kinase